MNVTPIVTQIDDTEHKYIRLGSRGRRLKWREPSEGPTMTNARADSTAQVTPRQELTRLLAFATCLLYR